MIAFGRIRCGVLALLLPLGSASSQQQVTVRVVDSAGIVVPFALVETALGSRRIADSMGVAVLGRVQADSLRLHVRRVGFVPFDGWVLARDEVYVRLTPLASVLPSISVEARRNVLLAQRGFYDRVVRAQRGAIVAEFLTPEDLERRGAMSIERVFAGSQYVRSARHRGSQTILLGRSDCGYTVLVDGMRVESLQETQRGLTSIDPEGTRRLSEKSGQQPPSIDELVHAADIVAIEVYPSAANAPSEIQARAMGGRGSCGIIAIWTGGR